MCYFDLNSELLNKVDQLLNNGIRHIFSIRKYDSVSAFLQLKWLHIRLRCEHSLPYFHSSIHHFHLYSLLRTSVTCILITKETFKFLYSQRYDH